MKKFKSFLFLIIIFISVFGIFLAREVLSMPLWDGYVTVYFPSDVSEKIVTDIFDANQIKNYICYDNQILPLQDKKYTLQSTFYNIISNTAKDDYSQLRYLFFFDKEKNYKVCYCPQKYEKKINSCIKELKKENINLITDNSVNYPIIFPILFVLLFVLLFVISKNKKLFSVGMIVPFIFVLCNSLYSSILSTCSVSLLIFVLSNIWKRENFVKYIYKNILFNIFLFLSIILSFSYSIKTGFIFLLSLVGALSAILLYSDIEHKKTKSYSFQPVFIRPASKVSKFAGKGKLVLLVIMSFYILIFFSSFITTSDYSVNSKSVLLPAANSKKNELPTLEDYSRWRWSIDSFPYKSLNSYQSDDEIIFSEFSEKNNIIVETKKTFSYDEKYRNNIYEEVESLPFNAIEKMLLSQKNPINPGFSKSNRTKSQINIFYIVIALCTFSSLLVIYFRFEKNRLRQK